MNRLYMGMLCLLSLCGCSEHTTVQPLETTLNIPESSRPVMFEDASTLWSHYFKMAQIDTLTKVSTIRDTLVSADMITFRHQWQFFRVYVEPGDQITLSKVDPVSYEGCAGGVARNNLYQKVLSIHKLYSDYVSKQQTALRLNIKFKEEPVTLEEVLAQSQKAIDEFQTAKVGVTPSFLRFIQMERKYFDIQTRCHFPSRLKKTYHPFTDEQLALMKQCVEDSKVKEALLSQSYRTVVRAYCDYLRVNDPEHKLVHGTDFLKNEFALADYFIGEDTKNFIRASSLYDLAFECGLLPEFTKLVKQLPANLQPKLMEASKASASRKVVGEQAEFPEVTGQDPLGKKMSLKDFRGKWVLVDCWATWCGVCHGEIPYTNAMEQALANDKLVFLGLSVDKPKDIQKWRDCIFEKKMKGAQMLVDDIQSLKAQLGIKGFPTYALINPEGKLVMTRMPRPSSGVLHHLLKAYVK